MTLRTYQEEYVAALLNDLSHHRAVLGVLATGGGKTVCAAEMVKRHGGPALFLCDAKELLTQTAEKFAACGIEADIEQGKHHAAPGAQVVIATTQSISRRLAKYSPDHFRLIIVDEAHRNTLGESSQKVLEHFPGAKVIGMTATPFRSDKRDLSSLYEKESVNIGLQRLIEEGFLSRIKVQCVPVPVSLEEVRTRAGDFAEDDLGRALSPHLVECAHLLARHATGRKTLVFLPLRETSRQFVEACNSIGLRAVHVDGEDRAGLEGFKAGDFDIICNAALLTTGFDYPPIDCVLMLRPTKSLALFMQCIGRGTRKAEGKAEMLLLDPLFLSSSTALMRASRLFSADEKEAAEIQFNLDHGEPLDLLKATAHGKMTARTCPLAARLEEKQKQAPKTWDGARMLSFLGINDRDTQRHHFLPASAKQVEALKGMGVEHPERMTNGAANRLIAEGKERRMKGLATFKQVKFLARYLPAETARKMKFEDARAFLKKAWVKRAKHSQTTC